MQLTKGDRVTYVGDTLKSYSGREGVVTYVHPQPSRWVRVDFHGDGSETACQSHNLQKAA